MIITTNKNIYFTISAIVILLIVIFIAKFNKDNKELVNLNSFHIIGHAYGSHHNSNKGLDPRLFEYLRGNNLVLPYPIFFSGDFIRDCTPDNWSVLINQFNELKIEPFLIRGTHERNDYCVSMLKKRHGALNYVVEYNNALIIAIDSHTQFRSLSDKQINFIEKEILNTNNKNIFIITHYVIWSSNLKRYGNFNPNPGSRYNITRKNNYWSKLHPMLSKKKDKHIYIIAGDMGGRPDSNAAHFDQVDNVTFVASGFGEIDFNAILNVSIENDLVDMSLVTIEPPYLEVPINKFRWPRK